MTIIKVADRRDAGDVFRCCVWGKRWTCHQAEQVLRQADRPKILRPQLLHKLPEAGSFSTGSITPPPPKTPDSTCGRGQLSYLATRKRARYQ